MLQAYEYKLKSFYNLSLNLSFLQWEDMLKKCLMTPHNLLQGREVCFSANEACRGKTPASCETWAITFYCTWDQLQPGC